MKPTNPNFAAQEQKMIDAVAAAAAQYAAERAAALAERERIGRNLDILAGWLAGASAATASIAAGAITWGTAVGIPASATGVGLVIPATAIWVAGVAGAASILTGYVYGQVTEERISRGYIKPDDPRASQATGWAGGISGAVGLSSRVSSLGFGPAPSAIGAGCAIGVATAELTRY